MQHTQIRLTLPEIARQLGEPLHRIRYAVEMYRIEPAERIGIVRLFTEPQVEHIRSALRRVSERRAGR